MINLKELKDNLDFYKIFEKEVKLNQLSIYFNGVNLYFLSDKTNVFNTGFIEVKDEYIRGYVEERYKEPFFISISNIDLLVNLLKSTSSDEEDSIEILKVTENVIQLLLNKGNTKNSIDLRLTYDVLNTELISYDLEEVKSFDYKDFDMLSLKQDLNGFKGLLNKKGVADLSSILIFNNNNIILDNPSFKQILYTLDYGFLKGFSLYENIVDTIMKYPQITVKPKIYFKDDYLIIKRDNKYLRFLLLERETRTNERLDEVFEVPGSVIYFNLVDFDNALKLYNSSKNISEILEFTFNKDHLKINIFNTLTNIETNLYYTNNSLLTLDKPLKLHLDITFLNKINLKNYNNLGIMLKTQENKEKVFIDVFDLDDEGFKRNSFIFTSYMQS